MRKSIQKFFFNNIWFNYIYRKYRISPLQIFKELEKSQYWPRHLIERTQLKQIKKLIYIAKSQNSFYKKLYDGIDISKIRTLEEVIQLPAITKKDIQENDLKIKSSGKINVRETTSGSTGDPLTLYLNDMAMSYRIAGRIRFYNWWNINPFDKGILIWGEKEKSNKREINPIRIAYKKIIKRTLKINIFKLNIKSIVYYYNLILKFNPVYLYGYTSALKQFAELLVLKKLNGFLLNIKIVIVTSEVLFEDDRSLIEKVLNCKVINEYGAADAGLFAFECPKGGLHIFEESIFMTTNELDELYSTELFNETMPLINYSIGDKVFFNDKSCLCGRTLKTIKNIEGRLGDVIIRPNGEHLSQYFFYYLIKNLDKFGYSDGISKYKVIQKGLLFDFFIVKGPGYSYELKSFILKSMYKEIGNEINVKFYFVNELPREKSGKLRFFNRES